MDLEDLGEVLTGADDRADDRDSTVGKIGSTIGPSLSGSSPTQINRPPRRRAANDRAAGLRVMIRTKVENVTKRDARQIVVAVPTDDDVEGILHYAATEAQVHSCGLCLVHAHDPGDDDRAAAVLRNAVAVAKLLAGPSVRISSRRVTGPPVESVLAADPRARVLVVRRRDSLNLLRTLAVGDNPAGHRSPIACVPPGWAPLARDPRPVLLGVEDPSYATTMLTRGLEIARTHRTSLRILHAWRLPGRIDRVVNQQIGAELSESLYAELHAGLEECRRNGDFADVPVEMEVRHGIAADIMVQAAREAQVLVLGRNRPSGDGTVHLGRTARAALHESPCPTVLLPSRIAVTIDSNHEAQLSAGHPQPSLHRRLRRHPKAPRRGGPRR
jgi:nucleotide-binding universal stress UspA family protein